MNINVSSARLGSFPASCRNSFCCFARHKIDSRFKRRGATTREDVATTGGQPPKQPPVEKSISEGDHSRKANNNLIGFFTDRIKILEAIVQIMAIVGSVLGGGHFLLGKQFTEFELRLNKELASKTDLQNLATKSDLRTSSLETQIAISKDMATKRDLQVIGGTVLVAFVVFASLK